MRYLERENEKQKGLLKVKTACVSDGGGDGGGGGFKNSNNNFLKFRDTNVKDSFDDEKMKQSRKSENIPARGRASNDCVSVRHSNSKEDQGTRDLKNREEKQSYSGLAALTRSNSMPPSPSVIRKENIPGLEASFYVCMFIHIYV
jgi:hypothetical protein